MLEESLYLYFISTDEFILIYWGNCKWTDFKGKNILLIYLIYHWIQFYILYDHYENYRRVTDDYRRVTDEYRWARDEYRWVTDDYRRVTEDYKRVTDKSQKATHESQTGHRRLRRIIPKVFFEYNYKTLFSERIWFPNAPMKRWFLLKKGKFKIWCLLKWWKLSYTRNETILSV